MGTLKLSDSPESDVPPEDPELPEWFVTPPVIVWECEPPLFVSPGSVEPVVPANDPVVPLPAPSVCEVVALVVPDTKWV